MKITDKIFKEKWKDAVKKEELGNNLFFINEYLKAAELHLQSAEIFKDISEKIENDELKNKACRNYLIELANHYQSKAFYELNENKNYKKSEEFFVKASESMEKALNIKIESNDLKKENDIINMNIHYLKQQEVMSKIYQLIKEGIKNYNDLYEHFETALTYCIMERDFAIEVNDLDRAKSAEARMYYYKGQISRYKGMKELQNNNIQKAKEYYKEAAKMFNESMKLDEKWDEYKKLYEKMLKVANRL